MRSVLVIGLGFFGTNLARRLAELENEVMVFDIDEEAVGRLAPTVTAARIGDCMDIEVLRSVGVGNFNVCFVCVGENFQASLEITSLLKELGARKVIAATNRDIHAKFLLKIGADEVINPERDMALRAAVRYSSDNVFDYFELTPEYAVFEMVVPARWAGKRLLDIEVRSRYRVNIIGVRNGNDVLPVTDAEYVFNEKEHILAAGHKKDLLAMMDKF